MLRVLAFAAGLLAAAPAAMAAQATTAFAVSATVVKGCLIAASNLAFGVYPAIASPPAVTATSTISVTCELGEAYSIGLDAGVNGSGQQRRMARTAAPAAYLDYLLFQDAALTQEWRNSSNGMRLQGTGSGTAQSYTVYGLLPGGQGVPVGAYVDTVTVNVRN